MALCLNYVSYHQRVRGPVFFLSEESIDLFSLGVQVDVIETRPSGEARDGGHLGSTKRERMEL